VVVAGAMVAAVGVDVVDSRAFEFEQFILFCELEFLGQLRAMWPWILHLEAPAFGTVL
jgi:hypothetical protein